MAVAAAVATYETLMLSRQSTPECTQLKGKINVFPRKTVGC